MRRYLYREGEIYQALMQEPIIRALGGLRVRRAFRNLKCELGNIYVCHPQDRKNYRADTRFENAYMRNDPLILVRRYSRSCLNKVRLSLREECKEILKSAKKTVRLADLEIRDLINGGANV